MEVLQSLTSEVVYAYRLLQAGFGACAPVREAGASQPNRTSPFHKTSSGWAPAAVAAAVGIVGALVLRRDKSLNSLAVSGLIAGSIGFGGALAWGSRDRTAEIARAAVKNINAVRDSHWLDKYPIDYA